MTLSSFFGDWVFTAITLWLLWRIALNTAPRGKGKRKKWQWPNFNERQRNSIKFSAIIIAALVPHTVLMLIGAFGTVLLAFVLLQLAIWLYQKVNELTLLAAQYENSERMVSNLTSHIATIGNPTTVRQAAAARRRANKLFPIGGTNGQETDERQDELSRILLFEGGPGGSEPTSEDDGLGGVLRGAEVDGRIAA